MDHLERDEYITLSPMSASGMYPGGGSNSTMGSLGTGGGGASGGSLSGKMKYCGVCGDKALGYNFNAISCESCKAFFRRNALKNKNFKCPFEGRCKIDPVTRRFCQKCRLHKCFAIGMKKEWIMSEEEKCIKRAKIEENRKKRMRLQVNSISNSVGGDHQSGPGDGQSSSGGSSASVASDQEDNMMHDMEPPQHHHHHHTNHGHHMTGHSLDGPHHPQIHITDYYQELHPHQHGIHQGHLPEDGPADGNPPPPLQHHTSHSNHGHHTLTSHHQHLSGISQYDTEDQDGAESGSSQLLSQSAIRGGHPDDDEDEEEEVRMVRLAAVSQAQQVHVTDHYQAVHHHLLGHNHSPPSSVVMLGGSHTPPPPPITIMSGTSGSSGTEGATSGRTTLRCMINNINPLVDCPLAESLVGLEDDVEDEAAAPPAGPQSEPTDEINNNQTNSAKRAFEPEPNNNDILELGGCRLKTVHEADPGQNLDSMTPAQIAGDKCVSMTLTPLSIRTAGSSEDKSPSEPSSRTRTSSSPGNSSSTDGLLGYPRRGSFNEMELAKMEELRQCTEVFKQVVYYQRPQPNLLDVIKMTDGAIRRIIKFSKRLSAFKSLCVDDQIALLKGGCTEILILRSAMAFDRDKECWQDNRIHLMIKLDILKEAKEKNIYEAHKRFLTSFDDKWHRDENIIHILTAITLFNPDRPHVVHRETISLEQKTYMYLLERYLEIKYKSTCEARSDLMQLMVKVEELRRLNEEHVKIYLDVDPNHVGPLLIEIFDLKQEHI